MFAVLIILNNIIILKWKLPIEVYILSIVCSSRTKVYKTIEFRVRYTDYVDNFKYRFIIKVCI